MLLEDSCYLCCYAEIGAMAVFCFGFSDRVEPPIYFANLKTITPAAVSRRPSNRQGLMGLMIMPKRPKWSTKAAAINCPATTAEMKKATPRRGAIVTPDTTKAAPAIPPIQTHHGADAAADRSIFPPTAATNGSRRSALTASETKAAANGEAMCRASAAFTAGCVPIIAPAATAAPTDSSISKVDLDFCGCVIGSLQDRQGEWERR